MINLGIRGRDVIDVGGLWEGLVIDLGICGKGGIVPY